MEHPGFFERAGPIALRSLAEKAGGELGGGAQALPAELIHDVRPLDAAGPGHVTFFDNPKYMQQFIATRATACFVHPKHADKAPATLAAIVTPEPYKAFAKALWLLYPDAGRPISYTHPHGDKRPSQSVSRAEGGAPLSPNAHGPFIHPSARLEDGATVEPGAVIGPEAQIGAGTLIAAGAVIGYRCHIGRNGYIGPRAVITHALIGDRVVIHAGAAIGQDGFGFAMGPGGHFKVPQIGRVIIQDNVEIGANTTIDRGALRDTVIGEGTKIDNRF
jgi:UDP-3-O-[3-hydroxymyristoyl] glucosamine N-acyltransferase